MMDKIKLDRSLKKAEINIVGNFNSIKSSFSNNTLLVILFVVSPLRSFLLPHFGAGFYLDVGLGGVPGIEILHFFLF